MDAVTGDRHNATAQVVKNAITDARNHPDDDTSAMNAIRPSVMGFGLSMASVFLPLYLPGRFTIADSRALRTLRATRGYPAGTRSFTPGDWVPYQADGEAGIGRQVSVLDVNGDKLPDVVVANKKGVFLFEQVRAKK